MNLVAIPLLLVALLLAGGDGQLRSAELLLSGTHEVTEQRGALIVGDTATTVPENATIPGPVYQIGGQLTVNGTITGDVVQLAGVLRLGEAARVQGELRRVAGTTRVAPGASIGRRVTLEAVGGADAPASGLAGLLVIAALLAGAGAWLARRRPRLLDTVGETLREHPVVALTVGGLLALTAAALLVFMAFTVVLIPVAIAGLLAGVATLAYAVLACGHLLGRRLVRRGGGTSTAAGVVAVVIGLRLVGEVPVVGGPVTLALLLAAVGAVVLTYYGIAPFRPADLPE